MPFQYAIRLQAYPGYEELFDTTFTQDRFTKILGVYHSGKTSDNPHYHFICDCDYKIDALRKYFKTKFTQGTGNKHLSIKPFDSNEKGYAYMFHESNRDTFKVIINRGHTAEDIERYQQINESIKNVIKENTPAKICEIVAAQLIRECQEENKKPRDVFNPMGNPHVWRYRICRGIWLHCKSKGDWFPNNFQLKRYVMKIQEMLCEDKGDFEDVMKSWYNDAFPF